MPVARPLVEVPYVAVGDIELPAEFRKLYDLAYNLWWAWTPRAQELFALIDGVAWRMYRNPVQLLINVEPGRWQQLLDDEVFTSAYTSVIGAFGQYLTGGSTWFGSQFPDHAGPPVAYLSMEYGLHACLPLYAGGLGVLSGDHLKSASDLGVPLVGIGLLYRHGYFHQTVDVDGLQQHTYVEYDFNRLPIRPVAGVTAGRLVVRVPFPNREIAVGVWVAEVGRIPLLLLSTDVPENESADRTITHILYVRSREVRLAQEIILGVGGVRALRALGIEVGAWHFNEGHSVFAQLERLRELMDESGQEVRDVLPRARPGAVFTTHTPVPAGHETFEAPLALRYVSPLLGRDEKRVSQVLALGRDAGNLADGGDQASDAPFNLTAFGIRTAGFTNAVSRLNAEVCDRMWRHLRPDLPDGEHLVNAITNGVHSATWCGRAMRELLERRLGGEWQELLLDPGAWERVADIPDEELWSVHQTQKQRFLYFLRGRLREQFARHGRTPDELRGLDTWFDPDVLTVGFARRFATYKRARLVFSDPERLRALLSNAERPLQIVFAGKAHPADRPGQELIRQVVLMARESGSRGRLCFLEDHDLRVAGMLVQGTDGWLNTPRRPMEASGTSGQKAAANGGLNVSILDGWWPEAYDGRNGWSIVGDEAAGDEEGRDAADAAALYRVLEEQVIPTYYERDAQGLPRRWIAMMKHAIATILPRFSASRMVRDYVELAYVPALQLTRAAPRTLRRPDAAAAE
jgi:starch phosphorylase